jgi:hypothetical protein
VLGIHEKGKLLMFNTDKELFTGIERYSIEHIKHERMECMRHLQVKRK